MTWLDPLIVNELAEVFADAAIRALESQLHTQNSRSDVQARREESNVGNCRNCCDASIGKGD